jgi:hypothetical protein
MKFQLIAKAPKCCEWCEQSESVVWTEFLATFGEKLYLDDGKIGSVVRLNFLSRECTRCGAITEVDDNE